MSDFGSNQNLNKKFNHKVEKRVSGDALSNTYDVLDESGLRKRLTEFYTYEILNRTYDEISEDERLHFFRSLWAIKSLNLNHIPQLLDVGDQEGIFALWDSFYGISIRDYIYGGGTRLNFAAAVEALAPLMSDLETAYQSGLYFSITPDTLCITDGGIIKLNTMVTPAADLQSTISDLANAVYFLVEGIPFGNGPRADYFPEKIFVLIQDVINRKRSFGSIALFQTELRFLTRAEYATVMIQQTQAPVNVYPQPPKKGIPTWAKTVTAASLGCITLVGMLVAFSALVITSARSFSFESKIAAESSPPQSTTENEDSYLSDDFNEWFNDDFKDDDYGIDNLPYSNVYEYTYTNPNDDNQVYDGIVLETDGYVYYRRYDPASEYFSLVREQDGLVELILDNCMPIFMTAAPNGIYFCDGYQGYAAYYYDGENFHEIIETPTAFLQKYENYLYFTNCDDWDAIYRLNLDNNEIEQITDHAGYELNIVGTKLIYINGDESDELYSLNLLSEDPTGQPLSNDSFVFGRNIQPYDDAVLYINYEAEYYTSEIGMRDINGGMIPFPYSIEPYCFKLNGDIMYYIDDEEYYLHSINLITGDKRQLNSIDNDYIITAGADIYYIDTYNEYGLYRQPLNGDGEPELVDLP
ncbi:MAG: DUF5050 domain-containing protein [Clostridiales bacterium]|jgi:hypothetical protein|nr:DUF5050 domain-containing protein [Clostridiales bacterium]